MIAEPGVERRPGKHLVRTWFAGVQFEVHSEHRLEWRRNTDPHAEPRGDEPVLARVRVDVAPPPSSSSSNAFDTEKALQWRWRNGCTHVQVGTRGLSLHCTAPGSYRASALDQGRGLEEILSMAGYPILERERGLVLHAAGAEVDGRVVLFLGPSGAGKSTAVSLVSGARLFAVDRAALLMTPDGTWWACAVPGGNRDVPVPLSEHRCLPLAGVGIVREWGGQRAVPTATSLSLVSAVAGLRAALLSRGELKGDPDSWDRLIALVRAVPVVAVRTVLGRDLRGPLCAGLREAG